jgi:hypothetical protein
MRTAFIVAGAALLVAGAALIAFAPFYTDTGFYRAELKYSQLAYNSSSAYSSTVLNIYSGYADNGELIALAGVIVAPVGGALLAYGLSAKKTEANEKQAAPATEPTQT